MSGWAAIGRVDLFDPDGPRGNNSQRRVIAEARTGSSGRAAASASSSQSEVHYNAAAARPEENRHAVNDWSSEICPVLGEARAATEAGVILSAMRKHANERSLRTLPMAAASPAAFFVLTTHRRAAAIDAMSGDVAARIER